MTGKPQRRIAVVTGTRADFGLLRWLIHDLQEDATVDLRVIATGMHLSPEFGMTIDEVLTVTEVDTRIECLLSSDTGIGVAKAVGLATISFAEAYDRIDPELVVVLGDRFEVLAAAQAALFCRRPVVHIHGGEVTTGAFDESIRHAITKLAAVHFVAAEPYRERVIQMGEDPAHVFNVGAPGLDHLVRSTLLSREELASALNLSLEETLVAVTYHPVTGDADPAAGVDALLRSLEGLTSATVVITMPNADPSGREIQDRMWRFVDNNPHVHGFISLGSRRYLSLLRHADAVVGNSSSGIIEAPALGTPTVNIGPRQDGRLRATSIFDVPAESGQITGAIRAALETPSPHGPEHQASLPYGAGGASAAMAQILGTLDLTGLLDKPFFDIGPGI